MSAAGGLFEEAVLPLREDGVHLRALRLTPDFDDAEPMRGAGVVVLAASGATTEALLDAVARPLARAGYFVVAAALAHDAGDPAAIEDLAAGLVTLRELARGKLGVIGVGAAGAVALAAAAELPQLDAVVHAGGALPSPVRLRRARAAILVHRAARGAAIADADVQALVAAVAPAKLALNVRAHDADDDFFAGDSSAARIAFDQTRQFLDLVLR